MASHDTWTPLSVPAPSNQTAADALNDNNIEEEEEAPPSGPKDFEFPPLCFEGGDCIIEISEHRDNDIIVPSTVLKNFPYFNAIIEDPWNEDAMRMVQDEEGKEVRLFTWGLRHVYDDGDENMSPTLLLEPGTNPPTFDSRSRRHGPRFFMKKMAVYIPRRRDAYDPPTAESFWKCAKDAHQMLFCMLFDASFQYTDDINEKMQTIADVVALSEFYGMREVIATRLAKDISFLLSEDASTDIADNPEFYMGLAQLLHSENLFNQSLGHLIASHCFHHNDICQKHTPFFERDLMYMEPRDLKILILEKRDNILAIAVKLLTELQARVLYLNDEGIWGGNLRLNNRSTFLASLETRKLQVNAQDMAKERFQHLARSVFGEWLHERCLEAKAKYCASSYQLGLYKTFRAIVQASKSRNLSLFGTDVSARLINVFPTNHKVDRELPADYLERHLQGLVDEAAESITGVLGFQRRLVQDQEIDVFMERDFSENIPWEAGFEEPNHLEGLELVEASSHWIKLIFSDRL